MNCGADLEIGIFNEMEPLEMLEIEGGLKVSTFCKGASYVCTAVAIVCSATGVGAPVGALWEADALGYSIAGDIAARHNM